MIEYFHIPPNAEISTPISKALFTEKGDLSAAEKKVLREDVESILMKGLFQTRTTGIASYIDDTYSYDQVLIAVANLRNIKKTAIVATMVQRNIPAPLVLVISSGDEACISWCTKRINQAEKDKRVIEDAQLTRIFKESEPITAQWLESLNLSFIYSDNLKEFYDTISGKLLKLRIADEVGAFIDNDELSTEEYRQLLSELKSNRDSQNIVKQEIKNESQFNAQMKLTAKLKELQNIEKSIINKMR